MGLDNIPQVYPCKHANTAILDDEGRIDCKATQAANQCPYKTQYENDPILKDSVPAYGMLGTDCWYRGKYGNYLLSQMSKHNPSFPFDEYSFFGDLDEDENSQGGISVEECLDMSEAMFEYLESWIHYVKTSSDVAGDIENEKALIGDWIYAAWWLKFVAINGEGSGVWY